MKKVLIVSRRLIRKGKPINWVSEIYLELLVKAGIMPIILPIAQSTKAVLPEYLQLADAMLMMEGGDVNPKYYGENYDEAELDELDLLKDELELTSAQYFIDNNKPLLGFCRGMQIINILHGGKIHKDVQEFNQNKVIHMDYNNYDGHRHSIQILAQTPLNDWYQASSIMVNTYHHQGIKQLGEGLLPMAHADDGLIEGVYNPSKKFLVGLQFHPERMLPEYPGNQKVFDAFVEAIKQ